MEDLEALVISIIAFVGFVVVFIWYRSQTDELPVPKATKKQPAEAPKKEKPVKDKKSPSPASPATPATPANPPATTAPAAANKAAPKAGGKASAPAAAAGNDKKPKGKEGKTEKAKSPSPPAPTPRPADSETKINAEWAESFLGAKPTTKLPTAAKNEEKRTSQQEVAPLNKKEEKQLLQKGFEVANSKRTRSTGAGEAAKARDVDPMAIIRSLSGRDKGDRKLKDKKDEEGEKVVQAQIKVDWKAGKSWAESGRPVPARGAAADADAGSDE